MRIFIASVFAAALAAAPAFGATDWSQFQHDSYNSGITADPGPASPTGSLAFQLSGATNDLHLTLLQKRDGTFWLALFQEAVSYDAKTHRDLPVASQPVTLKLPWASPEIRLFRPNASTEAVERASGAREIKLEVPDEVLLVEIRPPKASK